MVRNGYEVVSRRNMRDGDGEVTINNWVADAEKPPHLRLAANLVLPPGASIGEHVHECEAELFHVAAGSGEYMEDGTPHAIGVGGVMVCYSGHSHSIKNTGDVELVVNAVIITD